MVCCRSYDVMSFIQEKQIIWLDAQKLKNILIGLQATKYFRIQKTYLKSKMIRPLKMYLFFWWGWISTVETYIDEEIEEVVEVVEGVVKKVVDS